MSFHASNHFSRTMNRMISDREAELNGLRMAMDRIRSLERENSQLKRDVRELGEVVDKWNRFYYGDDGSQKEVCSSTDHTEQPQVEEEGDAEEERERKRSKCTNH